MGHGQRLQTPPTRGGDLARRGHALGGLYRRGSGLQCRCGSLLAGQRVIMNMPKHISVTYATRAGSTAEVAAAIGQSLAAHGFSVEVKPIKENPAVEHYDAILIGSAVRMGQWLPEAVKFVE